MLSSSLFFFFLPPFCSSSICFCSTCWLVWLVIETKDQSFGRGVKIADSVLLKTLRVAFLLFLTPSASARFVALLWVWVPKGASPLAPLLMWSLSLWWGLLVCWELASSCDFLGGDVKTKAHLRLAVTARLQ